MVDVAENEHLLGGVHERGRVELVVGRQSAVREQVRVPLVAYQVSGEYSMIEAAARAGWIDHDRVILESLNAIKRAGADLIISYYAEKLAKLLES